MKKFLPKTFKNPSGFTLVELIVVISIIAILAVIGITVFSGAKGAARDGRRRSEINSISKSIEAAKNYTNNIYNVYGYSTSDGGRDFPRGLPTDPITGNVYCIRTKNAGSVNPTIPPANPPTTWTTACPGGGWRALAFSMSTVTGNNLGATNPNVTSWTLCASLERTTTLFCASSLTR